MDDISDEISINIYEKIYKVKDKHNMIQEESANEIYEDEDINIDNLHEELDKFTNNINELKNSVGAGLKP